MRDDSWSHCELYSLPRRYQGPAVERRDVVRLRLEEAAHVGDEPRRAYRHALVGLRGEHAAVDLVRVRGVVRIRVAVPAGVVGEQLAVLVVPAVATGPLPERGLGVDLRLGAGMRAHDAHSLRRADREVAAPVVVVYHLYRPHRRVAARGADRRQYLALAGVGERVQARERAYVVEVRDHVGVEDHLLRNRSHGERGERTGKHNSGFFHLSPPRLWSTRPRPAPATLTAPPSPGTQCRRGTGLSSRS